MVRCFVLLISGIAFAVTCVLSTGPALAATAECSGLDAYLGCGVTGEITDDDVELTGNDGSPGSGGGSGSAGSGDGRAAAPLPPCETALVTYANGVPTCTADVERDGWDVVAPVTLVDIASFRPASATHHMQPNGWTIAGLPTNFYARTGTQIVPGTLLGRPAEVRFTPVQYYWDYGDGSSATRSRPGGTWAALGVAEFDVTPTSHVYATAGPYVIRLSVGYTAEYRYAGSPWVPIAGQLVLPANDLAITVGGATTVLVADDCRVNPAGPGC